MVSITRINKSAQAASHTPSDSSGVCEQCPLDGSAALPSSFTTSALGSSPMTANQQLTRSYPCSDPSLEACCHCNTVTTVVLSSCYRSQNSQNSFGFLSFPSDTETFHKHLNYKLKPGVYAARLWAPFGSIDQFWFLTVQVII